MARGGSGNLITFGKVSVAGDAPMAELKETLLEILNKCGYPEEEKEERQEEAPQEVEAQEVPAIIAEEEEAESVAADDEDDEDGVPDDEEEELDTKQNAIRNWAAGNGSVKKVPWGPK